MTTHSDPGAGDDRGTRFNVREFARTARGNHRTELDLAEFANTPLNAETLHAVRYLGRLESATMEHLRNLLVTATHKDARVTAFLVTWAFEKFWLADALDAVLEANGLPRAQDVEEGRKRRTVSESHDRRGPIRRAISAIRLGVPIIALHMTTGLVDEWVTRAAYEKLSAAGDSASLRSTIAMILDVKSRHAAFFEDDARRRLAEPAAARLTAKEIVTQAWPIGAIDRSAEDRTFFDEYVFGGDDGRARAVAIEARIAALPGLDQRVAARIRERLVP